MFTFIWICSYNFIYWLHLLEQQQLFFLQLVGLVQNDIKKVIAYSTCSQLGYMIFACGLSNYHVALFHLANHAFFKALLFLSAGAIIHSLSNEQDMRKYGGLSQLLPFTSYYAFNWIFIFNGFSFFNRILFKRFNFRISFNKIYNWRFFCL